MRPEREVVESDLEDFEEALSPGRLDEAVALYRGPFLSGFYLKDAPCPGCERRPRRGFDSPPCSSRGGAGCTDSIRRVTCKPAVRPADQQQHDRRR
jgi:hypothetical protein